MPPPETSGLLRVTISFTQVACTRCGDRRIVTRTAPPAAKLPGRESSTSRHSAADEPRRHFDTSCSRRTRAIPSDKRTDQPEANWTAPAAAQRSPQQDVRPARLSRRRRRHGSTCCRRVRDAVPRAPRRSTAGAPPGGVSERPKEHASKACDVATCVWHPRRKTAGSGLLLRGTGGVAAFGVHPDGSLRPLGTAVGGLPVSDGASGLAVY